MKKLKHYLSKLEWPRNSYKIVISSYNNLRRKSNSDKIIKSQHYIIYMKKWYGFKYEEISICDNWSLTQYINMRDENLKTFRAIVLDISDVIAVKNAEDEIKKMALEHALDPKYCWFYDKKNIFKDKHKEISLGKLP